MSKREDERIVLGLPRVGLVFISTACHFVEIEAYLMILFKCLAHLPYVLLSISFFSIILSLFFFF